MARVPAPLEGWPRHSRGGAGRGEVRVTRCSTRKRTKTRSWCESGEDVGISSSLAAFGGLTPVHGGRGRAGRRRGTCDRRAHPGPPDRWGRTRGTSARRRAALPTSTAAGSQGRSTRTGPSSSHPGTRRRARSARRRPVPDASARCQCPTAVPDAGAPAPPRSPEPPELSAPSGTPSPRRPGPSVELAGQPLPQAGGPGGLPSDAGEHRGRGPDHPHGPPGPGHRGVEGLPGRERGAGRGQ